MTRVRIREAVATPKLEHRKPGVTRPGAARASRLRSGMATSASRRRCSRMNPQTPRIMYRQNTKRNPKLVVSRQADTSMRKVRRKMSSRSRWLRALYSL
ncbi:MAG: hypothetical protein A2Z31_06355 [candidate division NC10 bacterium RBG_16_65_8]|nr:MAG: hypothetical protein A2Z31_06355 [candidate division NC10 bacterium RBG_16_65_8]